MKTTTYGVWTVKIESDGYFENRGDGCDFPLTVDGVIAAFAAADNAGAEWTVIVEKRIGDGFRCHDMEDATVSHIVCTGTFLSGVKVPARVYRVCRSAVSRLHIRKAATFSN